MRGGSIRLCDFYVCDDTHDEILDNMFSREELYYDELIFEGEVKSSNDESECNENIFSVWHNCLWLIIKI